MNIMLALKTNTKYGIFFIHELDHKIHAIKKTKINNSIIKETKLLKTAARQLNDYFEGRLINFDLPFEVSGSKFEQSIYKSLLNVKYGKTISYKDLAIKAKHPNAYRAVGSVMAKNRIPFIIPCHRVIKSDGSLGNYGFGTKLKSDLIKLEAKSK